MRHQTQVKWLAYTLLAPAFLLSLILIIYPLYVTAHLSLREGVGHGFGRFHEFSLGLANYSAVLSDPSTWASLGRALMYLAGSTGLGFIFGLLTALLLNKNIFARRWQRMLILLPWAVPGVVASITFMWMLNGSYGVLNHLLVRVGLLEEYVSWFTQSSTAMAAVIMPTFWKGYPFFTITLLAALQSVPTMLYDAATVDGASALQQFRHVTWAAIKNAALLALILNGLWTFRVFDIIYSTTGGGPNRATETLSIAIYNEAFQYFRMGRAGALGIIALVFVSLVVLALYPKMKRGFF